MRLLKKQKEAVLQWIAEGLESDEMNKRAAKFKPPFKVSKTQVAYYRESRQQVLRTIKATDETSALKTGLAVVEQRVQVLKALATKLIGDLMPPDEKTKTSLLWTKMSKTVANEKYDYVEFNRAEVEALRGLLEDIAAEVGQRVRKTDVTSGDKPIGHSGIDLKALRKQISDEELALLEEAARISERAERAATATPGRD